jgi:hypothetical protein
MNNLILKTFYFHETLSDNLIDKYNSSNSIIVSKFIFEHLTQQNTSEKVLIIGLYFNTKKIYVNVEDSHGDNDNIAYVPSWIYEYLNYKEDGLVNYMQVYPKTGNKIKIKPRGDFYAYLDDPVTALRNGFEAYSCLLQGTIINININDIPLEVEILETYINNEKITNQPIYIRGIEIEVDIESSIEEEVIKPHEENIDFSSMLPQLNDDKIDFSSMLPLSSNPDPRFPGKGRRLG